MGKRAAVLALILALAGVAASSASAFHGHRVYVASHFCNGHRWRPAKVWIACGDGAFYASGLQYSSYGQRKAHAIGTLWLNNCNPSCAQGTYQPYPGRVALRHIVQCGQRYYYSVIAWKFTGTPPPGDSAFGAQNIAPSGMTCSPVT